MLATAQTGIKTCGNCSLFIRSPYNPEVGTGVCNVMMDWKAKHKERGTKPTPKAIEQVYKELGGTFGTPTAICHPKQDRKKCNRFKPILP
jgi:hypothetical protein